MRATLDKKGIKKEYGGVVSYTLKVDGKPISGELEVISISIHREINVITRATVVIADGNHATQDFEVSSSNQFFPGKKIEISLGYERKEKLYFSGLIISNAQKLNNDCTTLTLECKHETVKMTLTRNSAHHDKTSAINIAESFFDAYGFKNANVTPAQLEHNQLVQFNNTDWDFMISKLDAANLMCILNNDAIDIQRIAAQPENAAELVKLELGEDILEFNSNMDARTQSDKVRVVAWNYTTQQLENEEGQAVTGEYEVSAELQQETTVVASGKKETEERQALADTKKIRQLLSKIQGTVQFFGRVESPILPGDFINLVGLGENFSGPIFVSATSDDYSAGDWTTTATLGWSDKFFVEQINPANDTAPSGALSAVQGLQTGVITDIIDTDGDFRVKLRFPVVNNAQEGVYARIATLDAGKNRGTFFRPEINDEVIVGFVNNDPAQPVVLGMMHSSAHAAPLNPEKANNKKGYVSRSEIKILIDDGEKSITISTPGGNVFFMNDSEKNISVTDSMGNKITMAEEGFTVNAVKTLTLKAGTHLLIEAKEITMKASGIMEIKAGTGANINSGGTMNIKGATVNIN